MRQSIAKKIRFSTLGENLSDPEIVRLMNITLADPSLLSLAAGFTDNSVMPVGVVSDVVEELAKLGPDPEHLQYGSNSGRPGLREGITRFLTRYPGEEELFLDPDRIFVTNGSQQALYLAIQVLCDPGDIVLVEQPTYFVFLEALKGLGVQAMSMPVKPDGGLDFAGLREMISDLSESGDIDRVKGLYIVSYFANPSTRSMSKEEKRQLGDLLNSLPFSIPFIEDAAYRELYYRSPFTAPSHLSLGEFDGLPTLYAGTFTKPFSTGLKVGYAYCSEPEWFNNLVRIKGQQDFGTSNFTQAIIEKVVADGRYAEYLRKLGLHYEAKMNLLQNTLLDGGLKELGWNWDTPKGGILMWLRAPEWLDTGMDSEFCEACVAQGVLYVPGELFFAERLPHNFIRLSLGVLDGCRLEEAGRRFASVARRFSLP